jgi:hypothetical protein
MFDASSLAQCQKLEHLSITSLGVSRSLRCVQAQILVRFPLEDAVLEFIPRDSALPLEQKRCPEGNGCLYLHVVLRLILLPVFAMMVTVS